MSFGKPIDLGDCLRGRRLPRYVVGRDYDWTYRLEHIKAVSNYSAFYWMSVLEGPVHIGSTLKEAIETLDRMHADEGAFMPGSEPEVPENVYRLPF
jgi:hypothetical protein